MPTPMQPDAISAFPIMLDLAGQAVLVVGGGEAAAAKCRLLAGSGARIRAVDPAPEEALRDLAATGDIVLAVRRFVPGDLDGVRLCYVALDDEAAACVPVAAARARGVLVNAVDRPGLCDFATPAIVRRGPITIAIATGGAAPALARNLRARIETAVPAGFDALATFCGSWRDRVAAALADRTRRRRYWDAALESPAAQAVLDGDAAGGERLMEADLARAAGGLAQGPRGRASLVGAGPGDVGHLTLAAVRAIQTADVILYDKLVGPGVLELARRDAARIDVGKRCGRHSMNQAAINALILRHARAGAHVVRLKGGDPLVFGRGGEEIAALREAGFAVEVIPGVTAALAAAAGLGIPLTHRGLSRSLHFVTAHDRDGGLPEQDWAGLAGLGGTLVVYMGARTLAALTARLLAAGMAAATPAVAVEHASLPQERRLLGTLADIAVRVGAEGGGGPTLVMIGAVVALADAAGDRLRDAA
jgi:uroporphyrin-III C-methyltransferase/precorrin-2 dehydrogenase/sirohydrochlorin ferrochelatase